MAVYTRANLIVCCFLLVSCGGDGGTKSNPDPQTEEIDCGQAKLTLLNEVHSSCASCHSSGGIGFDRFQINTNNSDVTTTSLETKLTAFGSASNLVDDIVAPSHTGSGSTNNIKSNRPFYEATLTKCFAD